MGYNYIFPLFGYPSMWTKNNKFCKTISDTPYLCINKSNRIIIQEEMVTLKNYENVH